MGIWQSGTLNRLTIRHFNQVLNVKQSQFGLTGYLKKINLFSLSSSYDGAFCVMDVTWPCTQFTCRIHQWNLIKN